MAAEFNDPAKEVCKTSEENADHKRSDSREPNTTTKEADSLKTKLADLAAVVLRKQPGATVIPGARAIDPKTANSAQTAPTVFPAF